MFWARSSGTRLNDSEPKVGVSPAFRLCVPVVRYAPQVADPKDYTRDAYATVCASVLKSLLRALVSIRASFF
jgi:hypothetical protein